MHFPRMVMFAVIAASGILASAGCSGDTITNPTDAVSPRSSRSSTTLDVTVSPKHDTLAVGILDTLKATVTGAPGNSATASWHSADTAIAVVSSSGVVRARAAGHARIVASYKSASDTADVYVPGGTTSSATVASVSVSPSSVSLLAGQTSQLSAQAKDGSGNTISGASFSWTTSNSAVATVSASGVVSAVASGTATITASSGGQSGTALVTVSSTSTSTTSTSSSSSSGCSAYSYSRLVSVSSASALASALSNAQAGDLIKLADGTYGGSFTLGKSGSSSAPIVVCGSSNAVLSGTSGVTSATVLIVSGAHNVTLDGFTVTNGIVGIRIKGGSSNVTARHLTVHDLGQEGIVLKETSKHNLIDGVHVYNTGRSSPGYGEGVYIGTTSSQWVNGVPDRSDSNTVRSSQFGPNITVEAVDMKDGTTGTVVQGNSFDGTGYSSGNASAWVNAYGNNAIITDNTGKVAAQNGYKVEAITSGWGNGNVFHNNSIDLSGASGYGVYVGSAPTGIVVGCDNTMVSGKLSNRSCQ